MKKSKIIITIAGYGILILSFVFIIFSLNKIDLHFIFTNITLPLVVLLIALGILYSCIFIVLAFNFSILVSLLHNEKKINLSIIPEYLRSNIGKYLPANLFHFAGRHILLNKLGYKNKKILLSNIIEFIILICISLFLLLTGLFCGYIHIPSGIIEIVYHNRIVIAVIGAIASIIGIVLVIKFKPGNIFVSIISLLSYFKIKTILFLIFSYSLFFLLTGSILYCILTCLAHKPVCFKDYLYSILSFSVCWQIGFISPGVPGGIGVREALLLLLFSGPYGNTVAFYSGIVLRIITISGDVIAFFYSFLLNILLKKFRTKR